jgi:hypothetical protein
MWRRARKKSPKLLQVRCFNDNMSIFSWKNSLRNSLHNESRSLLSISSHFSTRGSQVRCKLANCVSKFEIGHELQQSSQVHFNVLNYCKQMFIVQVEINNSMESSWFSGLPRRFVFHWIGCYCWVWTFVYKRSSNIEMYLRTLWRSSHPIFKLGNVIGKFATNWNPRVEKWLEIDN